MKTKDDTNRGRTGSAAAALASFGAESGAKIKKRPKGPGGRRKSLKRLDPAKDIQGFSSALFWPALLNEVRIWLLFGLALIANRVAMVKVGGTST